MLQIVELACKEAVFHFNKKHLQDPTVPMWIVMAKGETYYVDHVEANLPWTTKETPSNIKTKGAIKFKDCLVTIGTDNCASIRVLTKADEDRIRNQKRGVIRIISDYYRKLEVALEGITHGPIKRFSASCSSYYVVDLLQPDEATMFMLQHSGSNRFFRVLMPNEPFYDAYDDPKILNYSVEEDDDWEDLYEE